MFLIILLAFYVSAYGLLRYVHVMVHQGAYYENGDKKFYDHRVVVDPFLFVPFPTVGGFVKVVFTPVMLIEELSWYCIHPVWGTPIPYET